MAKKIGRKISVPLTREGDWPMLDGALCWRRESPRSLAAHARLRSAAVVQRRRRRQLNRCSSCCRCRALFRKKREREGRCTQTDTQLEWRGGKACKKQASKPRLGQSWRHDCASLSARVIRRGKDQVLKEDAKRRPAIADTHSCTLAAAAAAAHSDTTRYLTCK